MFGRQYPSQRKQEQNPRLLWENLQTLGPDLREFISGISLRLPPFFSLSLSGPQGRDSLLWQHRNNIFQASLKTDFWVPHADFLAWWEGPDVKKKKKEFLGDSNVQVLLVHTLS